jgi:LacI family transcriptional regulator
LSNTVSSPRRANLADVAKAAGVSKATASRALSSDDHPDVKPGTRQRIRQAAVDLGYRPSVVARTLRTGQFKALSVIIPDDTWGWWEPTIRGAVAGAAAEGYQLLVHPIGGADGGAASVLEGLNDVPTDGVLLVLPSDNTAITKELDRLRIPAVFIDDLSANVTAPTVCGANRAGAMAATAHLLSVGCRNVGLVIPTDTSWFVSERIAGFHDALSSAGVIANPELVFTASSDEFQTYSAGLEQALNQGTPNFDALFVVMDHMAAPVLRTLRAAGLSIPKDVQIVGFDDERAARLVDPQLSTMRQPLEAIGEKAVGLLLAAVRGTALTPIRYELPTQLVIRGSTRP